jgi:chromosome segregation ATPase
LEKKENNLHSSLIEKVQELSSLKYQLGEKTTLASKLQKTLDDLKSEADSNKSTAQSAHSQLAQIRTQLESLREVSYI